MIGGFEVRASGFGLISPFSGSEHLPPASLTRVTKDAVSDVSASNRCGANRRLRGAVSSVFAAANGVTVNAHLAIGLGVLGVALAGLLYLAYRGVAPQPDQGRARDSDE
jgi:hypothetical protein